MSAFTGTQNNIITNEQLGVFSGYIRRPIPSQTGMMAQVFGENGEDADTILALSLSKYQDTQVFVNIYLIKDPNGKIMKQGEEYPLICSFLGFVRRSKGLKDGMIAQIFSPNGEHADAVSLLSKSEYQDCLVFVDVRGSLASNEVEKVKEENIKVIDENYVDKITKQQMREFSKKEKQFKKINELIQFSEFLYRIEVLKSLGTGEDFQKWLADTQLCVHAQERTCMNDAEIIEVENIFKPFNYLPICTEHKDHLDDPHHIEENKTYYEMKHRLLTKEWAWHVMQEKFSFNGKSEPDPAKVIDWAASRNLSKYLPSKYEPVL